MPRIPNTICSECNGVMPKARAVYNKLAYCSPCYYKIFESVDCEHCGLPMRTPHGKKPAVCKHCKTKNRSCIRCNKPVPRAALIVDKGAVCPSCARFFKEPKTCPNCGHITHHLARDIKNGFNEPVCERCRRKDHITCADCGKNRRAFSTNHAGKSICAKCSDLKGVPYICPTCHRPGRRHSNTRCDRCYWMESVGKRFDSVIDSLPNNWVRKEFKHFFDDLFNYYRPKAMSIRLKKYSSFFCLIAEHFNSRDELSYESLVTIFGGRKIKSNTIIMNYFFQHGLIKELSIEKRDDIIQRARQLNVIKKAKNTWYYSLLIDYKNYQLTIASRYKQRGWKGKKRRLYPTTITGSLSASRAFLEFITELGINDIRRVTQAELDKFSNYKSGYLSSIRSFILYLNRIVKLFQPLKIERPLSAIPPDAFLSPDKSDLLLSSWLSAGEDISRQALICSLILLYAQNVQKIVELKLSDILQNEEGLYKIAFGKTEINLNSDVCELLNRYLKVRRTLNVMEQEWENPYLFPGSMKGSHLSNVTACGYLKKYDVTAKQLFATCILNSYLSGIRQPKVLVKALGISLKSAMKYYNAFDPRLVDEINSKFHSHE